MASSVTRRGLLQGALAGSAGLVTLPGRARAARPKSGRPNIVLVLTDQQSERTMGLHGFSTCETPAMDRLVAGGRSFVKSYCTDPTCVPARAGLFTGRHSCEHGSLINTLSVRDDVPDLGQWLAAYSDYDATYMGKWHVRGRDVTRSFDMMAQQSEAGENCDVPLIRAFEGYLMGRAPGRPFFAVVSLYNPHDVVHTVADLGSDASFDALGIPADEYPALPPNFFVPSAEPALVQRTLRLSTRDTAWPREKWAVYRWWYDRQMEAVDGCVDRLLDLLWNSRFRDDTVVIFTSDHGDNLGEHMLVHKQSLYEASVKVPMVLAWPGQWDAVGVDTEHLVSGLDVVPTVCELAGIAPPPLQRGRSLVPLMEGSGSGWRESLQVQSYVEGRALMRGDFKYITYRDDPKEFLFDVRQDPWELQDLAEDAAHASTLADLRQEQQDYEDTLEHTALSLEGYDAAVAAG